MGDAVRPAVGTREGAPLYTNPYTRGPNVTGLNSLEP